MRRLTLQIGLVTVELLVSLAPAIAQPAAAPRGQAGHSERGNQLIVRMLEMFESPQYASLTARVRHQCRLYDDTLVGSGNYWQQGAGDQRVSCFEMQTQLVGKTASFVQVFDKEYLWTDRTYSSGREVHRLEVARLKSRLPRRGQGGYGELLAMASVRGGISQMLADLHHRFDFDPPRTTQFNGKPVWAVVGHWRKSGLEELWPDYNTPNEDGDKPEWPAQLPHHVLVLVDPNNLLPYVIEQRRFADAYLASTVTGLRPTTDPMLRYEIFEVQFAVAIDPQKFVYKPGDVDWSDETSLVIERMNLPRR